MRNLVVLALLATLASGLLNTDILNLSDEVISFIADYSRQMPEVAAKAEKGSNDAIVVTNCIDTTWNSCQYAFNQRLGIDTSLTWRQADQIAVGINAVLSTNISSVFTVCNDNMAFYQCLGTSYYSCMDLYRIIRTKDADFREAYTYVQIYHQLQFMCNAGFEEVLKDYYCMTSLKTTQGIQACASQFNSTVVQDPSKLCTAVDQADSCLNAAYQAGCQTAESGWWGCEEFRVAFTQTCYGLRCMVNHG
ncbi:unnamed protein product, partial [Mesorhabditis spiculigera]